MLTCSVPMTFFLSFFLFERTTAPNQNGARRTRSRTAAMHCQTCLLLMTKTSKSNSGSSVANNSFQSSTWRTPLLLLTYELVHGICIRTRTRIISTSGGIIYYFSVTKKNVSSCISLIPFYWRRFQMLIHSFHLSIWSMYRRNHAGFVYNRMEHPPCSMLYNNADW